MKSFPVCGLGDRGELIELIQFILNTRYGFSLVIDGYLGKETQKAIYQAQIKEGIRHSGRVDNQTWTRMIIRLRKQQPKQSVIHVDFQKSWKVVQTFLKQRFLILLLAFLMTTSGVIAIDNEEFIDVVGKLLNNGDPQELLCDAQTYPKITDQLSSLKSAI